METTLEEILKINNTIAMRDTLIAAVKSRDEKIQELNIENKKLADTLHGIVTGDGVFATHYDEKNKIN